MRSVDITDLLDSHLSHRPEPAQQPTITTTNHNNQDHSNDNTNDVKSEPGPSDHQPLRTHSPPPPSDSSSPGPTTPSESTFAHGLLPEHPLHGAKPGQDDASKGSSFGSTTEDGTKNGSAGIESSSRNRARPGSGSSRKVSTSNIGVIVAVIVMVVVFVLILVGVLKEHRYLRFRGAVCLRRGKVPVHSNGRVNSAMKLKSNPKKTLHSLLGPSQLGFSRLRTYDSDSEEEEFPVFNRV